MGRKCPNCGSKNTHQIYDGTWICQDCHGPHETTGPQFEFHPAKIKKEKGGEEKRTCKYCQHNRNISNTLDESEGETDISEEECAGCENFSKWIPVRVRRSEDDAND
ncbi:hypothetical protein ES703_74299 [subsurface metagenome]